MSAARAAIEGVGDVATFRSVFGGRDVSVTHVEDLDGAEWVELIFPDGSRLTVEATAGTAGDVVARVRGRLERRGGVLV